jgi:hypothetical protein
VAIVGQDHHNTPAEIRRYVTSAIALADELGLSEAERLAWMPKFIELHAAKQVYAQPEANGIIRGPAGLAGI